MNDKVTTDSGQWRWTNATAEPPTKLLEDGETWIYVYGPRGAHWEIR